jgi:ribosomal protein S18 acetylase RimI-like enzyme
MPDMTQNIIIREIPHGDDPAMIKVEQLFFDMYAFMNDHGLRLGLTEKGEQKWLDGIRKGMGRFGVLLVAEQEGKVLAFAHGSVRLTPDYLGNRKVGVITHVYVDGEFRGGGIGENMVKGLEDWFREKEVHSVELQVLSGNKSGIAFWEKLGYPLELKQYRKAGTEL